MIKLKHMFIGAYQEKYIVCSNLGNSCNIPFVDIFVTDENLNNDTGLMRYEVFFQPDDIDLA
jgi:hypothetical protein